MGNNFKFRLLPNYFKKIGITIITLIILTFIILRIFNVHSSENQGYYRDFFMNGLLLSMFIMAFSKEKVEDERVRDFRYKSFASALIFGLMMTVFQAPIQFFLFYDDYQPLSAQQVMLSVMFWHLFIFSAIRREGKEKE